VKLLLIRHGLAEGQEGLVVGHADLPLSGQGRIDIGALVRTRRERPDVLVSSDLRRARESAEILAARWGMEVVVDSRLRELHFGEWEGRTWKELEQGDGARLDRWMRDWTKERAPGGESFADLVTRISRWLEEWTERSQAVDETLIVAHAGSIRAILCQVLGVPLERAFEFDVDYARATCIDVRGATPSVVCLNSDTLPGAPAEQGDTASPVDGRRCPLCGAENGCAIAAGHSVSDCWCHRAKVTRDVLERIPRESRGTVCICSQCGGRPSAS
jgi:alpha-ribazole phosphatase